MRALKLPLGGDQVLDMIRITITAAAYHAICSTMPEDAPLMAGPSVGRQITEAAVLDRLRAMGRTGGSYSDRETLARRRMSADFAALPKHIYEFTS
jgi:hypothetical protein